MFQRCIGAKPLLIGMISFPGLKARGYKKMEVPDKIP